MPSYAFEKSGLGLRRSDPLEGSAGFLGWRQRIIASFNGVPPRTRHLTAARPALLVLSRLSWRLARLLQSVRHLLSPRWFLVSAFGTGTDPMSRPSSAVRACIQTSGFGIVADPVVAAGLAAAGRMFETVQRAVAGQCRTALPASLDLVGQQGQQRVVPQIVLIFEILVSQGDAGCPYSETSLCHLSLGPRMGFLKYCPGKSGALYKEMSRVLRRTIFSNRHVGFTYGAHKHWHGL